MDGPGSAPQGGLQALCSKLVHPLLEVRRRTLQSLDFKLQHGLLTQEDLVQVRRTREPRAVWSSSSSAPAHILAKLQSSDPSYCLLCPCYYDGRRNGVSLQTC